MPEPQDELPSENDALISALKTTGTHWPEAPNPAIPYLDAASAYLRGGVPEVLRHFGVDYPYRSAVERAGRFLNNPDIQMAAGLTPGLGALTLKRTFGVGPYTHGYDMLDESGNVVGQTAVDYRPHRRELYVSSMESSKPSPYAPGSAAVAANPKAGSLGPADVRSLIDEFRRIYPKAETLTALRSSGARHGAAATNPARGFGWTGEELPMVRIPLKR